MEIKHTVLLCPSIRPIRYMGGGDITLHALYTSALCGVSSRLPALADSIHRTFPKVRKLLIGRYGVMGRIHVSHLGDPGIEYSCRGRVA